MGISNENDSKHAPEKTGATVDVPAWLNEELYAKILTKELANFERIESFSVTPAVAVGENYMTILLRVNLKAALKDGTTTELSYMNKTLPIPQVMRDMVENSKVFEKEHNTYNNYLPEFEALFKAVGKEVRFGPKVVRNDALEDKQVLVMEDLRPQGFKNAKRQNGLDMQHTKAALEKLAQFHAASACRFETKGPYPAMYHRCLCHESDGNFGDYKEKLLKMVVESLPFYKAEHLVEKVKTFARAVPDQFLCESVIDENEFNVLNHGDCWSNNVMFQYDSEGNIKETYFVDFQMSRYGSPAHDLLYFLITSTCLENKLKRFDHFIAFYWEKLTESLVLLKYSKPLPKLKDLHIALFKHSDWLYTAAIVVMPITLMEPNENAKVENLVADNADGTSLQRLMYRNPRYVEHITQVLPWMDRRGALEYHA